MCGEIVTDAINKLLKNIPEIRARTEYGIRVLIEALLLAGVTIMIIGHTRAVASVEHNIAHYWEMQQMLRGNRAPSHGASVGVATLMVWPIFKKFASEDISNLDMDAIRAKRLNRAEREQWMISAYGEANARAIMSENEGDFLTWEEQQRRILRAQQRISDIRAAIALMPEYDEICAAMVELGAPLTPAECGVGDDLVNLSMHCAKDYRTRYTLFKLLDECGLLDKYLTDYPIG